MKAFPATAWRGLWHDSLAFKFPLASCRSRRMRGRPAQSYPRLSGSVPRA